MRITRSPDHPITRYLLAPLLFLTTTLSPEVRTVLERVSSHYGDGAAHQASFVQIYTPAGFTAARRESGTLWIQAPQRLRFEYTAPEKKTFTYDAGQGRLYAPQDRQLTVRRLTPEERARLPIVFLSDPAELSRQYAISLAPAEANAARVVLKPRAPRADLAWLSVSIQPDGAVGALAYEDSSGNVSEFRFEGWRRDKPRPAEDFRVAGPPGTRVVEN